MRKSEMESDKIKKAMREVKGGSNSNASGTETLYQLEMRARFRAFNWGKKVIGTEWAPVPMCNVPAEVGVPTLCYVRMPGTDDLGYEAAMALAWWVHAICEIKPWFVDVRLVEVKHEWTVKTFETGRIDELTAAHVDAARHARAERKVDDG